jgi:hypothetical protein
MTETISMYEMYPEWGPTWRGDDTGDRADDGSVAVSRVTEQPGHVDDADDD